MAYSVSVPAVSISWIRLDRNGGVTELGDDKYDIMNLVGIHARDLRVLDPMLSCPSAILGREKLIVLNLEYIRAIITAKEVRLISMFSRQILESLLQVVIFTGIVCGALFLSIVSYARWKGLLGS